MTSYRRWAVGGSILVWWAAAGLTLSAQVDSGPLARPPAQAATPSPLLEDAIAAVVFDSGQVVPKPAGPAPTPRHTGIAAMVKGLGSDVKHLPSRQNLLILGVGGALALAVHPFDDNVNKSLINSQGAKNFFKAGAVIGELGTLLGGAAAVYTVGRVKDEPKVSHLGMDLLRSLAIPEGVTQTLKYTTRRERPDGSGPTSFPSGHAADTFGFATALERHLGWRGAVPAYIFASYVAISRMPANRHWLSDAVFGAAVGTMAGRTVTRHGREYPVAVAYVPGGAAIVYTRRGH